MVKFFALIMCILTTISSEKICNRAGRTEGDLSQSVANVSRGHDKCTAGTRRDKRF